MNSKKAAATPPTLPEQQRQGVAALQREGFAVDAVERSVVRMRRGNDFRLVRLDGTQRRALGAKR